MIPTHCTPPRQSCALSPLPACGEGIKGWGSPGLNGHLAIGRVNRFANYCQISSQTGRGIALQRKSLAKAYQLLENGWGLNLGGVEEQHLELSGELKFIEVKVRFYPPVTTFILEGDRRHPKQTITKGIKNNTTGELLYVDYTIPLPRRSIDEFMLWVHRYMDAAQVISPPSLLEKHHQAAIKSHIPHPNCHKGVFTEHFLDNESKKILHWLV